MSKSNRAKEFIGHEVEYIKGGSRQGWKGILSAVDGNRIIIDFDNGVGQDYSLHALQLPKEIVSNDAFQSGYHGYLKVKGRRSAFMVSDIKQNPTSQPLPKDSCLIVNMQTGQVVGVETDKAEAEQFARDQANDSVERHAFMIFTPDIGYCVSQPMVDKIKSYFKR